MGKPMVSQLRRFLSYMARRTSVAAITRSGRPARGLTVAVRSNANVLGSVTRSPQHRERALGSHPYPVAALADVLDELLGTGVFGKETPHGADGHFWLPGVVADVVHGQQTSLTKEGPVHRQVGPDTCVGMIAIDKEQIERPAF